MKVLKGVWGKLLSRSFPRKYSIHKPAALDEKKKPLESYVSTYFGFTEIEGFEPRASIPSD